MSKNLEKKNRGITLIALVVTIIVLLILAGISITMLTSSNGIIKRTTEAGNLTLEETAKEKLSTILADYTIRDYNYGMTLEDFLEQIYEKKLVDFYEKVDDGVYNVCVDGYEIEVYENGELGSAKKLANGTKVIAVSNLSLDQNSTSLKIQDDNLNPTITLSAIIEPDNASNKKVIWKSSDETVATVDQNGVVTAIDFGKAVITATSKDNAEISDSCEFNIDSNTAITSTKSTHTATTLDYSWKIMNKIAAVISKSTISESTTKEVSVSIAGHSETYTVGIGDTVMIQYGDISIPAALIGFKHDTVSTASDYATSGSKAGMTFWMTKAIYSSKYIMNTELNWSAYTYTTLKSSIDSFFNGFDGDVKPYVKRVRKTQVGPHHSDYCDMQVYFWPIALTECGLDYSNSLEGSKYPFFENRSNIPVITNLEGEEVNWWTRTTHETTLRYVDANFSAAQIGAGNSTECGVVPAFCI